MGDNKLKTFIYIRRKYELLARYSTGGAKKKLVFSFGPVWLYQPASEASQIFNPLLNLTQRETLM